MTSLSIIRGRTFTITETVGPNNANGVPALGVNGIAGWSFWFTAKFDPGDAIANAAISKLPASWNITTNGNATTAGVVFCTLLPADTVNLPAHRVVLSWDVTAKDTSSNLFQIDGGSLTVDPDVSDDAA